MAKYRHVHIAFWQDPKVMEEMTPEDKYFYLYLLTNPNTTQIGVYKITKKQMAFDLGYSTESVNSLLNRFINTHKMIQYNELTRELAVINWGKYNLYKGGRPVMDCIKKELVEVKDKKLLVEIMNHIPNPTIYKMFENVVNDTLDDMLTTSGQKEKEKEKEKEKRDIESSFPFNEIIEYLNQKANTQYRSSTSKTKTLIKARFAEGFTLDDFKKVVDVKVADWANEPTMVGYLRPATLFGTKFESYLNQPLKARNKGLRKEDFNLDEE